MKEDRWTSGEQREKEEGDTLRVEGYFKYIIVWQKMHKKSIGASFSPLLQILSDMS